MRHFIVLFVCTFLTPGNLQAVDFVNNYRNYANTRSPVTEEEEHIYPVRTYQTIDGNFYGTARLNPNPCPRHKESHDVPLEPINYQIKAAPHRRFYFSGDNIIVTHFDPANFQEILTDKDTLSTTHKEEDIQAAINDEYDVIDIEASEEVRNFTEITTENHVSNIPVLKTKLVESRSLEVTTEEFVAPPSTVVEPPESQSNEECIKKKKFKQNDDLPDAARRFFISPNYVPSLKITTHPDDIQVVQSYLPKKNDYTNSKIPENKNSNENGEDKYKISSNKNSLRETVAKTPTSDTNKNNVIDPTKGPGISVLKKSMLMDYDRICYACNSEHKPTCLSPDRGTTVKYCRKGTTGCLTKSYKNGSTLFLVRDCGNSCDDNQVLGSPFKYKTCSVCHTDLCNGAISISVHSLLMSLPSLAILVLLKH